MPGLARRSLRLRDYSPCFPPRRTSFPANGRKPAFPVLCRLRHSPRSAAAAGNSASGAGSSDFRFLILDFFPRLIYGEGGRRPDAPADGRSTAEPLRGIDLRGAEFPLWGTDAPRSYSGGEMLLRMRYNSFLCAGCRVDGDIKSVMCIVRTRAPLSFAAIPGRD